MTPRFNRRALALLREQKLITTEAEAPRELLNLASDPGKRRTALMCAFRGNADVTELQALALLDDLTPGEELDMILESHLQFVDATTRAAMEGKLYSRREALRSGALTLDALIAETQSEASGVEQPNKSEPEPEC